MCDVCVMVVEKKREEREKGETKMRARAQERSKEAKLDTHTYLLWLM